jgi:hypothetical protein
MQEEDPDQASDQLNDEVLQLRSQLMQCDAEIRALRAQLDSQRRTMAMMQVAMVEQQEGLRAEEAAEDTPLVAAARRGDDAMVSDMIDELARSGALDAALLAACRSGGPQGGCCPLVQRLLDAGACVQAEHNSALIWACVSGDAELVRLLLDRGANAVALHGCPLRTAVRNGHHDVVKALLRRGASPLAERLPRAPAGTRAG